LEIDSLNDVVSCQGAGHAWLLSWELAVQVPSVLIPEEFNVLLNRNHAGYLGLTWTEPRPFRFDPRLFASEPQTL
jgi:RES domain-containing protein